MPRMRYSFYFICIRWILAIPQFNLYFTANEVSENEYNDGIGVGYNCFRFASNLNQGSTNRQIFSYCMSESSFKFHIKNDTSLQTFSFADLATNNISSEDLYLWSTPIDIIELYQIYLETIDLSLAKQIFYNCTLPRFGSMCQYEFYYYHDNYSSLYEMIYNYYEFYQYGPTNLTCYTHLKCHRGYPPACLDWTEICDGVVDCLDGDYDEEYCWQLEFNECKQNEYRCNNGQCIPYEFVQDDVIIFDCIDGSDEKMKNSLSWGISFTAELIFGYEDVKCERTFVTSSCIDERESLLLESMFSIKDESVSDECWSAFKCYCYLPTSKFPQIHDGIIERTCIPIIRETCPEILFVPNIPIFFGHVYTAYNKNELSYPLNSSLLYLCSNKSFYDDSFGFVVDTSLKNTICFKVAPIASNAIFERRTFTSLFHIPMDEIFLRIKRFNPIINFPLNQCNEYNLYQCINSSKCISFNHLINGISDCPYNDDENIVEDTNPHLFSQFKYKYYKCLIMNKYIPQSVILNGDCDCGYDEHNFCEDEHEFDNFTGRTISFQTICDSFQELYPITIDGKNATDETECEQWECDNIYTHCDKVWDCLDGKDEIDCDGLPSLLNCSSDYRMCVTLDTYQMTCLPLNQINDGKVDCLGGTDERILCRHPFFNRDGGFYCDNSLGSSCIDSDSLCTTTAWCFNREDEQFCQINRSIPVGYSICRDDYISFGSDIEKFLCHTTKYNSKPRVKYFKIDGFNQSSKDEINKNELINIITLDDFTLLPLLDNPRCNRGLDLRVWLNKSSNLYTSTCLCPPSYYGNQCQYQNQRLSLSIRFHAPVQSRQILFAILVLLIDNTTQRTIHSYEQFTYLSIRDCKIKFNLYLFYSTRPKHHNRIYSIHIDIYEKYSLTYRGSFLYPVKFSFLPVHRLAFIVDIPSDDYVNHPHDICSHRKCFHGKCRKYFNMKETFCQCKDGWSGQSCDIPFNSTCSFNSLSIDLFSNNRSICVCQENYFGSKCYLRNRICDKSRCENNGLCIPHDTFMLSTNRKYFCICPKGFNGNQCEIVDNQLNIIFDKSIHISHSIFIHFIRIIPFEQFELTIPKTSSQRSTTFQTTSQATNSIQIYWSQPFHLTFIETLDKTYYLSVIQSIYNHSTTIVKRINSSHRCPSINELVNQTFSQLHVLRRVKSYHLICQQYSPHLQCFHDDFHLCLCYDYETKRLANCFQFDHQIKFDCFGQNHCENNGQCFQDSPDCPKRSICICPSCYYGNRCQFSTSEFGLSLDAILAYHIIPNVNIFHQTSIVKISFSLTILFMIIGLINGFLSLITFKNKNILEVGCGIYLLSSSITTILIMILFELKYLIYLSTQISIPSNQLFLKIQCYSLDFLLRICLNMDQWLNACVALERAITIIQARRFVRKKSKQLAKKVLILLLLLTILTSIHDPIHRRLFQEENENDNNKMRTWCIVTYSSNLQIYNRIMNTFHFFVPFLINFISSIILIQKRFHQKVHVCNDQQFYKDVLHRQIREHQHLLIAPVILFILALPRLILSYLSKCMNSTKDSWIFLCGYFVSFIPTMITFFIFVLPSKFYRNQYQKSIAKYRTQFQQRFGRIS